jgi:hypothetical protein
VNDLSHPFSLPAEVLFASEGVRANDHRASARVLQLATALARDDRLPIAAICNDAPAAVAC